MWQHVQHLLSYTTGVISTYPQSLEAGGVFANNFSASKLCVLDDFSGFLWNQ